MKKALILLSCLLCFQNISKAEEDINICTFVQRFAMQAMIARQEGQSVKETQKHIQRGIDHLSNLSKEGRGFNNTQIEFLTRMASLLAVDASQVRIEKTVERKKKAVKDYAVLREKDCNIALAEISKE